MDIYVEKRRWFCEPTLFKVIYELISLKTPTVYSTGSIRPIRDEIMLSPSARLLMVEIAAKTIRIIPNVLQSPRFSAFSPANPAMSPRIILIRLKTIKKAARATPAPTLPAAPPIRTPSPSEPATICHTCS